jgi:flagellar protein FliS
MTMTNPTALRARYLADAVTTASPGRLIVMLYDRLLLDLTHGEEAFRAGERLPRAAKLLHGQEIVLELLSSLDLTAWPGAGPLAKLYSYLLAELISANVHSDADRVAACRGLVEPLRDAWAEAAVTVASQQAEQAAAGRPEPVGSGRVG